MIPFVVNDLTNSVSPIKLFEYCAAGLPAVAPRLNEIINYEVPIFYYDSLSQFIESLMNGMDGREKLRDELVEFGKVNSWTNRYNTVMKYLE